MKKNEILFLSADEVKKCLTMKKAIKAMREAFILLSKGEANIPLRTSLDLAEDKGTALYMPVYIPSQKLTGIKIVSVHKDNPVRGLPMIHALVIVSDSVTGAPLAIMDGEYLTALRTGAASGLATDLLARKESELAAIIGAGVQGRYQLEGICAVRHIKKAIVLDTNRAKAESFADEMSKKLDLSVIAVTDITEIKHADILCTATSSYTPVFSDKDLKTGVHINGIGSYTPEMYEIPQETVIRAKVIVDSKESCLAEAGDIIQPLKADLIPGNHIHAELGEIAAGIKTGRINKEEITLFKSVGTAIQDLTAASYILKAAKELKFGKKLLL